MKHPDYPGVSSMTDRHGKTRWRLRRSGHKDVMLPRDPHSQEFDEEYQRAILGQSAKVVQHPSSAAPLSMKAAYRILKTTAEWRAPDECCQTRYCQTIERILTIPIGSGVVGDGPMEQLKRSHIKMILSRFSDTSHMERIVLICIRKLTGVALDEEWIETDPAYRMSRNPTTQGHKTWPADIMAKYEAQWAIGTRQRTAYALALWLGKRLSDVCRLRWDHLTTKTIAEGDAIREVDGFEFTQFKGRKRGRRIFLPMTEMLRKELAPLPRTDGTVLATSKSKPDTENSLCVRMAEWCKEAGIERGIHHARSAQGARRKAGRSRRIDPSAYGNARSQQYRSGRTVQSGGKPDQACGSGDGQGNRT